MLTARHTELCSSLLVAVAEVCFDRSVLCAAAGKPNTAVQKVAGVWLAPAHITAVCVRRVCCADGPVLLHGRPARPQLLLRAVHDRCAPAGVEGVPAASGQT